MRLINENIKPNNKGGGINMHEKESWQFQNPPTDEDLERWEEQESRRRERESKIKLKKKRNRRFQ